ncbi:MAG: hypothetical protein LBO05_05480 [Deltaproteobacteria bacterium]|jgi:hypothetical protein|nr:hypothetical protein [Deltaproteobacteria bacterium]
MFDKTSLSPRAARQLLLLAVFCLLLPACGAGTGRQEELRIGVELGKTTAVQLVRFLGPPVERASASIDRPLERLHFNVPYYRYLRVEIKDENGKTSEKIIRGKNQVVFQFQDGALVGVH